MTEESKKAEVDALNVSIPGKIAIATTGMLSGFALSGIMPVMPAIAAHFAHVPGAEYLTRAMVTVVTVSICIVAPFAAGLAERYGSRRILVISLGAFGLAGCASFFADNLYAILANRVIVGFATGVAAVLGLGLIAKHSIGNASNRWFGYVHTVSTAASLILIPLAGFVGRLGWNWPFLLYAIILPVVILTLIGFAPDPPRSAPAANVTVDTHKAAPGVKQWWMSIPYVGSPGTELEFAL